MPTCGWWNGAASRLKPARDVVAIRADRATVYNKHRDTEMSLMSKSIYKAVARESETIIKHNTK